MLLLCSHFFPLPPSGQNIFSLATASLVSWWMLWIQEIDVSIIYLSVTTISQEDSADSSGNIIPTRTETNTRGLGAKTNHGNI